MINFILHNSKAGIDDLCNCFDVSSVNIRNILIKIEKFTKQNKLGKLLKNDGYYYFENNNINFDFEHTLFAIKDIEKKERIIYIILKLILEKNLNLTAISKELNVSRITLNGDLIFIKDMLQPFGLFLVSVQWKGVFLESDLFLIQKFSIFFIVKLYIEEYFSSPLKRAVNPFVFNYFRALLDEKTEKKIFSIANKLYKYFDIKLGVYHYYILIGILVFSYFAQKNNFEFHSDLNNLNSEIESSLNKLLTKEDKKIIGENFTLINLYFSNCLNKKYPLPFIKDIASPLKEICSFMNLQNNSTFFDIVYAFMNNLYLENRFMIPNYIKFTNEEKESLKTELCQNIIRILEKYDIPFNEKEISLLYKCICSASLQIEKKSALIIDSSVMNWMGENLKAKLKRFEKIDSISVVSYFNFKSFPLENYDQYDIFFFIDLTAEKKINYPNKLCYFITYNELLKTTADFSKIVL